MSFGREEVGGGATPFAKVPSLLHATGTHAEGTLAQGIGQSPLVGRLQLQMGHL